MWELGHKEGRALKNWCLQLCCWRRLLCVPWTAWRSNQSILKEINSEYSLEGLMLKLQYFGHLMWRANSLEKTLMPRKTEGRRRRGGNRGWLDGIINSMDMSLRKLWELVKDRKPGVLQSTGPQRVGHYWATEQQQQQYFHSFFRQLWIPLFGTVSKLAKY